MGHTTSHGLDQKIAPNSDSQFYLDRQHLKGEKHRTRREPEGLKDYV